MGGRVDVTVRAMTAQDAGAVARLAGQLGYPRSEGEVLEWMAQCAETRGAETVRAERGPRQTALVACVGEEVAGWVEISIVRPVQACAHGLIGGLVVKDTLRSRGIGALLRERAEAWAWDQGVDTVVVTSRSIRTDAHRFYLRDGYRRVKTSEVFAKVRAAVSG